MERKSPSSTSRLEKLRRLKNDPVAFAETILGFKPFPYQEKWLRDPAKRLIACCGRQIGKSTTAAVKLIHFAVTNPKTTSIIVSATLRQSIETFDKVLSFVLNTVLKKSVTYRTRTRIHFSNGSRIICLPCGRYGSSLRGLTVHFAVLDEAAFMPEDVIANVVFPMLATTNGTLWMLTTPWSKDHITYRAFMDTRNWSVYHLPSEVNPLITRQFLEEQRVLVGEERFRLEYLAEFVDDAKAYFPMTLLRKNIHICDEQPCQYCDTYNNPEKISGLRQEAFAGYDPGGRESYAAIVIVTRVTGYQGIQVRSVIQEKAGSDEKFYTNFTVKLADLHKTLRFKKVCVDATGLGGPILEHMRELGLPAEGLKLTQPVKEELASRLKIALEQNQVELPNDLSLLNSLNCIEYERTRAGGFQFTHRQGTYDDAGWALMLALKAASETIVGETIIA
ncbi:MAG: phage terminase large subunit [Thermofilum sp.]